MTGTDVIAPAGPQPGVSRTVGIIYPPPELRSVVDKTAQFVARNGDDFEAKIAQTQASNPKFTFLKPTDPYHAYYRSKIKDFREGRVAEPAPAAAPVPDTSRAMPLAAAAVPKPVKRVPTVPPPPLDFVMRAPETITTLDLEIIKLTAQFVARNGKMFLAQLTTREVRNPQFDFLKPHHSVFPYFQNLVDQYTKVHLPPKVTRERLQQQTTQNVLERIMYRVEFEKHQEDEQRKAAAFQEQERIAMSSIDWNDFAVVETIDFLPHEEDTLPPPLSEDELRMLARAVASEFAEPEPEPQLINDDMDMDADMDVDMDDAIPAPAPAPVQQPAAPTYVPLPVQPSLEVVRSMDDDEEIKIVRNYKQGDDVRGASKNRNVQKQLCPRCGREFPIDELQEHMRIELLSQDYLDKKTQQQQRNTAVSFAENDAIGSNLKAFAQRRTDLFGGAEQLEMGERVGEGAGDHRSLPLPQQLAHIHATSGVVHEVGPQLPGTKAPAPIPQKLPTPAFPPQFMARPPPTPPVTPGVAPLPPGFGAMPGAPPGVPPPPPMAMGIGMPPVPPGFGAPPGVTLPPPAPGFASTPIAPPPPPPPMPAPPSIPLPPGMNPAPAAAPEFMPDMKRARAEVDPSMASFAPEDAWLARFPNPVTIAVSTHTGQSLQLTVGLNITVTTLKELLSQQLSGLPPAKMRLKVDGPAGFLKDQMTLAAYNLMPNSLVQLSLKERGGRKK
eukprot:TRINITY_DN15041_c0_g1_i1.p1 TRINITY_DN15041_c0_g1~~TRINITY_DN15041_c0_g1_i1.p1  ORF type:complete len:741 (+),score=214.30 TRINITY_DN15041_c0_g1_i1:52-2223(+)